MRNLLPILLSSAIHHESPADGVYIEASFLKISFAKMAIRASFQSNAQTKSGVLTPIIIRACRLRGRRPKQDPREEWMRSQDWPVQGDDIPGFAFQPYVFLDVDRCFDVGELGIFLTKTFPEPSEPR